MRLFVLVLLTSCLVGPTVEAQQGPVGGAAKAPKKPQDEARPDAAVRKMYEDIEIMRRLIGRAVIGRTVVGQCASCHSTVGQKTFSQRGQTGFLDATGAPGVKGHGAVFLDVDDDGWADPFLFDSHHQHHVAGAAAVEGSYLKGHGVVYHLTLPAQAKAELSPSKATAEPKTATDWEQMRRQLRGESPAQPATAKKATLVDVLLSVVAENGKNLTQLPAGENLTLIVTFRDEARAPAHSFLLSGASGSALAGGMAAPVGGLPAAPMGAGAGGGSAAGPMGGAPLGAAAPGGGSEGIGAGSDAISADKELELLGDLHLKRGNLSDAVSAFERALAKAREVRVDSGASFEQAKAATERANQRLASLVRKLADVHLRMNNLEAARKVLESISVKLAVADGQNNARPEPKSIKLPGKMTITVPKRLLEQVGGGSVSYAEFQEQVVIETPSFEVKK